MLGQYLPLLQTAKDAIDGWRATATSAGIELNQLNLVFPDGKFVIFSWDATASEWQIDTQ